MIVRLRSIDVNILRILGQQESPISSYSLAIALNKDRNRKINYPLWVCIFASLFPALNRLCKHGLIDWEWERPARTGRARHKLYKLTPRGAGALLYCSLSDGE